MRSILLFLLVALSACQASPTIEEGVLSGITPCHPVTSVCAPGYECRSGVCLEPLPDAGGISIGPGDDTRVQLGDDTVAETPLDTVAPSGDPSGGEDVPVAPDAAEGPDLIQDEDVPEAPDVVEKPDPGIPAQPDECTQAGYPNECPTFTDTGKYFYCRYEESTQNLTCSSSEGFQQYKGNCFTNDDCEVTLGCHFGVCTHYCELIGKFCPAPGTCTFIGHPKWGSCLPAPE